MPLYNNFMHLTMNKTMTIVNNSTVEFLPFPQQYSMDFQPNYVIFNRIRDNASEFGVNPQEIEIHAPDTLTLLFMIVYLLLMAGSALLFACALQFLRRRRWISGSSAHELLTECHHLLLHIVRQQYRNSDSPAHSSSSANAQNERESVEII